jgi:hypothetical protein
MPGFLPCIEIPATTCPPRFRVAASNWIDMRNVGDLPPGLTPPAGVRLRWNCPSVEASGPGRGAFPETFTVLRSEALDPASLFDPAPTVGHEPSLTAPKRLWSDLNPVPGSRCDYAVPGGQCDSAQAILVVTDPASRPVTVSLIGTDGTTRVTGEINPGDRFYFEMPDIRQVAFSTEPKLTIISGLLLSRSLGGDGFEMRRIARIDARAWFNASLVQASERLTTASSRPFLTIGASDWAAMQVWGAAVVKDLDINQTAPANELLALLHAIGRRWEAAALMGWGFLDGEHPVQTKLDEIDRTVLMKGPTKGIFAYQIVAEFPLATGIKAQQSELTFTSSEQMRLLEPARVRLLAPPKMKATLINHVDQTPSGMTPSPRPSEEQPLCTSIWECESHGAGDVVVFTMPMASPSAKTGAPFSPIGTFSNDGAGRPQSFRGLAVVEQRDHDLIIPFYDSDIWLNVAVGDHWDRRLAQGETPHLQPALEYDGRAVPIWRGRTIPSKAISSHSAGTIDIDFDPKSGWQADRLAASEHGEVEVLMRDTAIEPLTAVMQFGPPSPNLDRNWVAEAETTLSQTELFQLRGGILLIGTFIARIISFGRLSGSKTTCTFEAIAKCAGAELYPVLNGFAVATCSEYEGSPRLWISLGTVGILEDRSVTSMSPQFDLPPLEASQLLYVSTRVVLNFKSHKYEGPLSPRVGVPYLHPAPKPPEACFDIRNLAVDYYGRTIVRAEARGCDLMDVTLDGLLAFAAGIIDDSSGMTNAASPGLYGAQRSFDHRILFDAFELLTAQAEGSVNTLGVSYVRSSDARESTPSLHYFPARRVD